MEKLFKILAELSVPRPLAHSGAVSFRDESFAPVDAKSTAWATTERKTMRSFFAAKTPNTTHREPRGRIQHRSSITPTPVKKAVKKAVSSKPSSSAAKKKTSTASISSFFVKKS